MPQTITGQTYFNGHSMVGELQRVLVCSPRTAGWNDPITRSRWAELGFLHAPDFATAQAQHEALCRQLEAAGGEVVQLGLDGELSLDAVYAHDASLPTDFGLILMNPGKANRVPEASHQREFCQALGIPVVGEVRAPGKAEAGDIVWIDSHTLLVGHGYRTNGSGIAQIQALLSPHGVEVISVPLPHGSGPSACLHLMSLMSILDDQTVLVDISWLGVPTIELLRDRGFTFIEIDPSERETLACNVLSLGRQRLLALDENSKTNERLRAAGFDVRTFPGSELCVNGSGGPTCLTRPLLRS